jgi:hypothetical protein
VGFTVNARPFVRPASLQIIPGNPLPFLPPNGHTRPADHLSE